MSATRFKLNEAAFFLQHLGRNVTEYPGFNYYLSAFVSSARSVTWIMRSEYVHMSGWETWYSSKQPSVEEGVLLKKMNDVRVRTEKVEPLKTKARITFFIPNDSLTDEMEKFWQENAGKLAKLLLTPVDQPFDVDQFSDSAVYSQVQVEDLIRVIEDFPDDNILDICKSYYSLLENLVTECEALFGS